MFGMILTNNLKKTVHIKKKVNINNSYTDISQNRFQYLQTNRQCHLSTGVMAN